MFMRRYTEDEGEIWHFIYVGMGVAAKLCLEGMEYDSTWIEYLSKKMMNGVMKRIPEVRIEWIDVVEWRWVVLIVTVDMIHKEIRIVEYSAASAAVVDACDDNDDDDDPYDNDHHHWD